MKTINEVLAVLKKADPKAPVYFAPLCVVPTSVDSWRGSYNEPALGWAEPGNGLYAPTVEKLIKELEESISGKLYYGWKGGEYTFTGDDTLHIDNPGRCNNVEIKEVEDRGYQVLIHLELELT